MNVGLKIPRSAAVALGVAVLGACSGLKVGSGALNIDETFRFEGASALTPEGQGSYALSWKAVPANGVSYQIYSRHDGSEFDFNKSMKTTSETSFTTLDLRFDPRTCFVVRYSSAQLPPDTNTKELCTKHERIVFKGLTSLELSSDATLKLKWDAVKGDDLTFRVYKADSAASFQYATPLAVLSAAEYVSAPVSLGETACFDVRLYKGNKLLSPETRKLCHEGAKLAPFAGVESTKAIDDGTVEIAWKKALSADVVGYKIYEGSGFKNLAASVGAGLEKTILTGLDSTRPYIFGVRAVGPGGLEDANTNFASVVAKNPAGTSPAGKPAKLAFSSQPPAAVMADFVFSSQPQVEVQDAKGTRVTRESSTVAIGAFQDPTCATPVPSANAFTADALSVVTTAGVASFSNMKYTEAPQLIFLKATSAGLESTCSNPVSVLSARAVKLAFQTQPPASAIAGVSFATQPQIELRDDKGNWASGAAPAQVTLSLHSDSLCTSASVPAFFATANPVTSSSGLASVSGARVEQVGTFYLKATSGTLASVCSSGITVGAGSASRVRFVSAPSSSATVGQALASAPVVEVWDANGNKVGAASNTVTLTMFDDANCTLAASGGTLSATSNPLGATSGVAAFANVTYSRAGTFYLRASAPALASDCSSAVTFAAGAANRLRFAQALSGSATAGVNFSTQPIVEVLDASGNVVSTATHTVALTAFSDPLCSVSAPGTLQADSLSVSASAGLAAITGVRFNKSGPLYLKAESSGLASACSNMVNVGPNVPAKVAFFVQPSANASSGNALTQQPQVIVTDANDNWVQSASAAITLSAFLDSLCTISAGGIFSASSNPVGASAGNASFAGVKYSQVDSIYLRASASGLASACSTAINVTAPTPSRLAFVQQPSANGNFGSTLLQQPRVEIQDTVGSRETTATNAITLTVHADASCAGASLGNLQASANPLSAVFGLAIFNNVQYWATGTVYFKAVSGSLAPACSTAVNVISLTPFRVVYSSQPSSTANVDAEFGTMPVVQIQDDAGNVVRNSVLPVTLAAFSNPTCSSPAGGLLTVVNNGSNAVQGQLAFQGVKFSQTGNLYLQATAAGVESACSSAIGINSAAVSATLSNTPAAFSTDTALNVTVGGTGVTQYAYNLLPSDHSCLGLTFSNWRNVSVPVTDSVSSDGAWTLCVKGRDATLVPQTGQSRYQWVRDTAPPTAALSNTPSSGDGALAVTVGGIDVVHFRYTFTPGAVCPGTGYSAWFNVSTPISDAVTGSGPQIVCVQGRDLTGNVQSSPTSFAWTVTNAWPPVGIFVGESVDSTSVRMRWRLSGAGLRRAISYQAGDVAPTMCSGGTAIAADTVGTGSSYLINGLAAGTEYSFRICEVDAQNNVASGNVVTVSTWPNGQSSSLVCDSGDLTSSGSTCVVSSTRNVLPRGVGIYTPGNITIDSGATLGTAGGNTSYKFTIAIEGTMTVNGTLRGNIDHLLTRNLTVGPAGTVTAAQLGWQGLAGSAGQGPGAGGFVNGSAAGNRFSGGGGSNGGMGGDGIGANASQYFAGWASGGTSIFGSYVQPITLGSSGGGANCDSQVFSGGHGGGAIRITVMEELTHHGNLSAAGGSGGTGVNTCEGGGGAGGSVWIDTSTFVGGGTITANGGNSTTWYTWGVPAGGGGGGRIAIHYTSTTFSGAVSAAGGSTGLGYQLPQSLGGGVGTIFWNQKGVGTTLTFDNLSRGNAARGVFPLEPPSGLPGNALTNVQILNSAIVQPSDSQSTLVIQNMHVSSGSSLNVDSLGFGLLQGPGGGTGICNASHGGLGQYWYGCTGSGATYGSPYQPVTMGSGGSVSSGGGALKLTLSGTLTLNGRIGADGGPSNVNAVGAGAGGSVWLDVANLQGTGSITADGGTYHGWDGGGGGRVAVYFTNSTFTGTMTANSPASATPGSVFLRNRTTQSSTLRYVGSGAVSSVGGVPAPVVFDLSDVGGLPDSTLTSLEFTKSNMQVRFTGTQSSLVIQNLTIGSGTVVNYDGLGSAGGAQGGFPGAGVGGGQPFSGGQHQGGSYGGAGAILLLGPLKVHPTSWGSPFAPIGPGSGGSSGGIAGTPGGGSVRLIVTQTFTLNGLISANAPNISEGGGAGSGGAIWIDAGTLAGNGGMRANGGSLIYGWSAAGGGGRIALAYDNSTYTGYVSAAGGEGGGAGAGAAGGAGSIYTNHRGVQRKLVYSQHDGISIRNSTGRSVLDLSVVGTVDLLEIRDKALVQIVGTQAMTIRNVLVGSTGALTMEGRGYAGATGDYATNGVGPPVHSNIGGRGSGAGGGGGGHAGAGGRGGNAGAGVGGAGGYGDLDAPVTLGSGGGQANSNSGGGDGGGALRLVVEQTLTVNGRVSASGLPSLGGYYGPGGGGGGSVWITASTLEGTGSITAEGGAGGFGWIDGGGGGGGGRISLQITVLNFNGTISAAGGAGGVSSSAIPGLPGDPGTMRLNGQDL